MQMKETAIFAAGCFWHVQYTFDNTKGVVSTLAGYTGGTGVPNYNTAEKLGHAEAVKIQFDNKIVSYEELLDIFWKEHNPTSLNKQGNDTGRRYRSAIFYTNEKQKQKAEKSLKKEQEKYKDKIVTEIMPASDFYAAEDYHQKYFENE
jgi:peptide-methionine (S)-S-oxide reductase